MREYYQINLPAVVVLILGFCSSAYGQSAPADVVKFKLEDYGWQAPPREPSGELGGDQSRLVAIDHQGRILLGFTTRENDRLATREHPGLSFHISRFTKHGELDLALVLPTNNLYTNGLYLGSNDQIIARSNDTLQWMSEETGIHNQSPIWQVLAPCPSSCHLSQSPSRDTLIVRGPRESGHFSYVILDTTSPVPHAARTCLWIALEAQTITDKFAYQSTDGIRFDARRWPLCEREHDTELTLDMRNGMIRPLSDEVFLLLGTGKERRGVELVAADGQLKFQHEMPKHDIVAPETIRTDERGNRFAFTVETWRGGSKALDISGKIVSRRVVVFSESGEQLASVQVNPLYNPLRYQRDFDFALSPDGRRLAVLDAGLLTVIDIQ